MIYLIDDTPIESVSRYVNLGEFGDCIVRIADLQKEDLLVQNDVECVLIHESFHNHSVTSYIKNDFCKLGKLIPLVVFSDGHLPEARFGREGYIASLKKTTLYSRLKSFLMSYRETRRVDLTILASPTKKEETLEPKKKEVGGGSNSLADMLVALGISLPNNLTDNKEDNSSKIYCLGRGGMKNFSGTVQGEYVKFTPQLVEDNLGQFSHKKLHDLITETFTKKIKVLYLDTDLNPSLCMCLAMHIRLTFSLPDNSYLCPIVFISDNNLSDLIKKSEYAQIFMTQNIFLQKRGANTSDIDYQDLSEEQYMESFLDRIVIPAPKGSNHSIANQWGASRLYSILTGRDVDEGDFSAFFDVNKELYYKYIKRKISTQVETKSVATDCFKLKNAAGKHILLIDDQAHHGWNKVLEMMFSMSHIEVINERIRDYSDFSVRAKELIENKDWDLILLDLRLAGIEEDAEVDTTKMSGYSVLKKIKELNRGNQIIILTASNKVWNLKTLLHSEYAANGYFLKESPEYEFPNSLSIANLMSFKKEIEKCFERSYLKNTWRLISRLEKVANDDFAATVLAQLRMAYNMAARADSTEEYQFAYIAFNQLWEIVTGNHNIAEYVSGGVANRTYQLLHADHSMGYYDIAQESANSIVYKVQPLALYSRNSKPSVWEKLAIIYLQKWGLADNGILYLLSELIKVRNCLLHINNCFADTQNIRETDIYTHRHLSNSNLIYSHSELKRIYTESARQNLLYEDSKQQYILHKDIASSSLGIRLQLYCIEHLLDKIIDL